MPYVLDANSLMRSFHDHYDPAFCPAFWEWLKQSIQRGLVEIIDPVANEIETQDQELWQLLKQLDCATSIPLSTETFGMIGEVLDRLDGDFHYSDDAKQSFIDSMFPQLIAYALTRDAKIVTLQKSNQAQRNAIRLPDLCFQLNISCIDPFEMLRRENARFILEN